MNTHFSRSLLFVLGLLMTTPMFAYTGSDCTVADNLSSRGFITYHGNCREYNLDASITRQEVAAVAVKVAETCGVVSNVPPVGEFYCENIFNDVSNSSPNTWACRAVETLANYGIVSSSNNNFRPLKSITRAEALAIMLDSAGLSARDTWYDDWRFRGSDAVGWQKPLIQYAYDNGMIDTISGFGANKTAYRKEIFTYAEAALELCNAGTTSYNNNNTYYNNYNYNNYTYSGVCGMGQYSSNGSCYSCTGAPWNGYYTTRGSCEWNCNSGYYKSGNTCVSNNNSYNNYGNQQCSVGQYWLNGSCYSCVSAPSNGYYLTAGSCDWTCVSGYSKSGSSCVYTGNNNSYYGNQCNVGQYWSGNSCYSCSGVPSNGYYTTAGSCDWTCVSGYYKSGNSCVSYNTNYNNYYACGVGQYLSNNTCYSCNTKPNNSYYITAGSCDWTCNSGYYNNGGFCIQNTQNCSTGQYLSGNICIGCTTKPSNAYYTNSGTCDWNCDSGYYKSGNTCVSSYNYNNYCGIGQYSSGNTCYSCSGLPYNAYYTTTGSCDWNCNSGYYKSGNTCVSNYNYNNYCGIGQYSSGNTCYSCSGLPYNAYYTTTGTCDWTCNSGYYKSGNTCVSNYNYNNYCGIGQYSSGNTCYSCSGLPYNAYYTTTGSCDWTCNSGYYKSGNTCVSNTTYTSCGSNTCGVGQYCSGSVVYSCNTKPSNSYYTTAGSCDWACNSGYLQIGNSCVWY